MRLLCRLLGHRLKSTDIGHGTGVTVYHCSRCPHWWAVS